MTKTCDPTKRVAPNFAGASSSHEPILEKEKKNISSAKSRDAGTHDEWMISRSNC